ncbi:Oidioi.mRNA.OKI2018_I69.PAR.g11946.t1.cds [Oikopleura dioica]|uniref:Oidioi.mRNA.OKI2018_I69.PAR.g11946.t1.cds n=1 Tax=Oikopleura dioica TaxID=34765 RepID=A0ABN7RY16_OIKDI|nr:Oidioi.mRNA.OKI2018_I69.PAR.g11946.t1.cds [Oikopleura dioica]
MISLRNILIFLFCFQNASGECTESSCRKKVSTNGGLKENYEVKFKNHLREGQASELILMRDIVVKRNGKFVTQTATPLIVATRIANGQVVVDVIQKNRGRKSTLGTARGFRKLRNGSFTVGVSVRSCNNDNCQLRVKLNGKDAKKKFGRNTQRKNYPFKVSRLTLSKVNFVACKNIDRIPVTECSVQPRMIRRQFWKSLSEPNCGRTFKVTPEEMHAIPSFIRTTLKDDAVDKHLNECLYASEKLRISREHVVGGVNAYPGLSPWTASIRALINDNHRTCEANVGTATLIDKCWLLTAEHVVGIGSKLSSFKVRLGDYFNRGSSTMRQTANCDQNDERMNGFFGRVESEHESEIEHFIRHPDIDGEHIDVALIKMKNCVEDYTKYIQPVCLPESLNEFSDDICGVVSGWGKSSPTQGPLETPAVLQITSIAHISEKQCKEEFDKQNTRIDHKFKSGVIFCAGTPDSSPTTRDTCSGDSGGPFVSYGFREEDEFTEIKEDYARDDRAVLLGITSSGAKNCNVYGFYSRVTSIMDWIYEVKMNAKYN